MSYAYYDRLTALDASFLELETPAVHMHVGSVGIFESGPLARPDGGVDFDRIRTIVEAGLRRVPRFRQKIVRIPATDHPVWVDDPRFNLPYHLRHTALPTPGNERQLKRLTARIMSQKLDRAKAMWEMWVVEGLQHGRFALISKIHHCLIDGISGVDLAGAYMRRDPNVRLELGEAHWLPRPAPSRTKLIADDLLRRVSLPVRILARVAAQPRQGVQSANRAIKGLREAVGVALTPASETPFNRSIGPHRRFDWTRFELSTVRGIKDHLGGKLNDVVLACVAGAVRRFLLHRNVDVDGIDFRVLVPVSTRTANERGKLGNRVSMIAARLPVGEKDLRRRYDAAVAETAHIKESGQLEGTEAIEHLSDWTTTTLLTQFSKLAASRRSFNLIVTNVPGPAFTSYLDGARLLESYPLVPLFSNQALGIALLSYDGGLYWGFNADWETLPDLHVFVEGLEEEFELLRKL
jgi:diacylglycerol O-acyltransferase / wax synthase